MNKKTTDQGNPRLSTDRDNYNGPQERAGADNLVEAIDAGILTPEGSLALDGGHLPGNKDQLHAGSRTHGHASPVPGANGKQTESEGTGVTPQDPQPKATGGVPPVQRLEPEQVQDDFPGNKD